MGLRKRFLLVVVGVPGSPAEAQRSEVGRFRSTSAAEDAGRDEWKRILFVHAPHVDRYRIVIEDDGVEVGDVPMPELPADAGPGILDEVVTPLGTSVGALGEPIVPEPEPGPEDPPGAVPDPGEPIGATGELTAIEDDPNDLAATGEHAGLADELARDDMSATGEVPVVPPAEDPAAAPPAPYMQIEEPPDGPVPESVIARFAEMVRAEEDRAAERRARDDAG